MASTHPESTTTTQAAVPLPHRAPANSSLNQPPVWSLESDRTITPPLLEKCDKHGRQDGICCKELKDDDDRTLIDPDIVRDV